MIRLAKFGVFGSLLLLLGSCQSFTGMFSAEDNLEAAKNTGPPAGAFDAALQQEYIGIAQTELDEYDWQHGDLFARKGIAAGNGEAVMPEDPSVWRLPGDKADKLGRARQMLLDALNGGGREKAPADAARAQAMYDCWIQEEETRNEGHQPDDIAFCRNGFFDALAKVQEAIMEEEPMAAPEPAPIPPEPPVRDFLTYFEWDSTNMTPAGQAALQESIRSAHANPNASIMLTGHADTSGAKDYNQMLSERRALVLIQEMTAAGISRARISWDAFGQTRLLVPTADGVREQGNRAVEIQIK